MNQTNMHFVRRDSILGILDSQAKVEVTKLANQLSVSEMTIRRDLQMLEREGKLRRVYGGAVRSSGEEPDTPSHRSHRMVSQKKLIAQLAKPLVQPGMDVFIGGGSTTQLFAETVRDVEGVMFSTDSLDVAEALSVGPQVNVDLLGGTLRHGVRTLIGLNTIDALQRRFFDIAFIGVAGIRVAHGFLDPTEWHAWLARSLRMSTRTLAVLSDHTKFGKPSNFHVLKFDEVDIVVTDNAPEASFLAAIEGGSGTLLHPAPE